MEKPTGGFLTGYRTAPVVVRRPFTDTEYIRLRPSPTMQRFSVKRAMPARSRTRTTTRFRRRRRRYGRRRNYRGRTNTPFKIVRVLKTVKYIALNPGAAGAIATAVFTLNTCNDPTGASGTNQPLGFDQHATLYQRYAVIRARAFVECTSADATNPVAVGLHADTSPTTLTSYEHYKEMPLTTCKLMTPEQDKVTLSMGVPISKLYGHRKFLTDDRLSAQVSTDPTDQAHCHIFAQPVDQATDIGVVHLVVTLYQTVVFYMPKPVARS